MDSREAAHLARIVAARKMFLFPVPADVDQTLAGMENRSPFDAQKHVGDFLRASLASFPARHRLNLETALREQHPAWTQTLTKLRNLLLRPGGCIVGLLGQRGTGKTQLGVALGRYVAEQALLGSPLVRTREPALYASLPALLARVRATFNSGRGGETEARITSALSRCRLLILDETHEAGGSDWAASFFTTLIDARYADALDTVIITNQKPATFAQSIGESVADRLRECGGFVECCWPSFRGGAGEDVP